MLPAFRSPLHSVNSPFGQRNRKRTVHTRCRLVRFRSYQGIAGLLFFVGHWNKACFVVRLLQGNNGTNFFRVFSTTPQTTPTPRHLACVTWDAGLMTRDDIPRQLQLLPKFIRNWQEKCINRDWICVQLLKKGTNTWKGGIFFYLKVSW